jgi:GNAT superfamily N-acetyltransferase
MNISIRRATEVDLPFIGEIFYAAVHSASTARYYTAAQQNAWAPLYKKNGDEWRNLLLVIAFVATIDDQVVGFADIHDRELDHLYVHPSWEGKGIGKSLVHHCLQEALSLRWPYLLTDASYVARPFFERLGFQVEDEEVVERRGEQLPRFKMRRIL